MSPCLMADVLCWSGTQPHHKLSRYGVLSFRHAFRQRHLLDADESPLSILTPAMQTSGQRWVGLDQKASVKCQAWETTLVMQVQSVAPEFRTRVFPQGNIGSEVWTILNEAVTDLSDLPQENPRHLLCFAFPNAAGKLHKLAELWRDNAIEVYLVPDTALRARSHTFGFSAISARTSESGPLQVYVGVPWGAHEDAEHVVRPIAEALVHEGFEMVFGYSHSEAAVAELLLQSDVEAPTDLIPFRVLQQLQSLTRSALRGVIDGTAQFMLRRTLVELDVDRQWEQYVIAFFLFPLLGVFCRCLVRVLPEIVLCNAGPCHCNVCVWGDGWCWLPGAV